MPATVMGCWITELIACAAGRSLDISTSLDTFTDMANRSSISSERGLQLLQALAEPTRFNILRRLHKGERCVCELTDALDAAQSRLSFHLKVLKDAGLVTDRREGRWMYYTINPDGLHKSEEVIQALAPDPSLRNRSSGCC